MQVISRSDAKAAGQKRYFTGKPCPQGHVSERMVNCKVCVECSKENTNAWKRRNPEYMRAYFEKYYAENKDSYLSYSRTRKARQRNAPGTHNAKDIANLWQMQRGKCACCGVTLKTYHVDHIYPLARGGSNDRLNLQLLCVACNKSKHAKDPIAFMQERGKLL